MGVETAAILLVGTAVSIYSQREAAKAEARAAGDSARLKELEAIEIEERNKINEQNLRLEQADSEKKMLGEFAQGNVDITMGSPLAALEATNAFYTREIENQAREARFRSSQSIAEGNAIRRNSEAMGRARQYQEYGTFITAGAQAYSASGKK